MKKLSVGEWVAIVAALAVIGGFVLLSMRPAGNEFEDLTSNAENILMEQENTFGNLEINIVEEGAGEEAKAGDTVSVHYTGKFANGEVFDSSIPRGEPITFTLGAGMVIQGWDQGLQGMKVGGKRSIVIPPSLGYGADDYGPIPGNSTLYFDVELVDILK